MIIEKDRFQIIKGIENHSFKRILNENKNTNFVICKSILTYELSSEKFPTLHYLLPIKCKLLKLTKDIDENFDISKLKSTLNSKIEEKLPVTNFHIIATILYPNMRELKDMVTKEKKEEIISLLIGMCNDINIDSQISNQSLNDSPNLNDSDNEDFSEFCDSNIVTNFDTSAETEVNNYLSLELKSKILDKDLITFW